MYSRPYYTASAALLAAIAGLSGVNSPLLAADATWNSTSTGFWSTGSNWSPAASPGATSGTTNPDTATFNTLGAPLISVDAGRNIANITFSMVSGVNNYLFTGSTLSPSGGGTIQTASGYTGAASFSVGLSLQGSGVTLNSSGAAGSGLNFGTITTAASSITPTLTLTGSNTGVFNTVQGVISQGAGATLAVSKTGTGTWLLNGANTYTGGTTLNGGTLITNSATALGASGTITIAGNSTLRTNTALTDASARMTISDGATLTFDTNNANQTWAGILGNSGGSNTAGLTKTGLGSLTLQTGANSQTYRGTTTVNMGTLTVNALTSNTATVTNPINSSSTLVLGGGNLIMRAGTQATATAGSAGTTSLTIQTANASILVGALVTGTNIAPGTTVSAVSGTTVTLSQQLTGTPSGTVSFGATTLNQTFNGTTLNAGISQFIPASNAGTNVIDFGAITRNNGSLLNLTTANGYTLNATGTTNNAGGVVKGVFFASNDFARVNTNTLAAATYTTQNAAGSWTSGTTNYVTGAAVTGSTASGAAINALKLNFAGNQNITITDTLTVNDGILFGSAIGNNNSTISGGTLTSGSGDLIIVNNNAQATFGRNTITSTLVDNGGGATNVVLYSPAAGMLYLGGTNTYTGNTYIGGGFNAQTATAGVTVGGAAGARIGSSGATVFLNGGTGGVTNTLRVGNGDATGDVLGTIQVDNGNLTLNRTDTNTLSATVRGTAGGGYITLGNTGNTTINLGSGNNTFQQLTSSAAGTLNLAGAGSVNTFINTAPFSGTFVAGSTVNFNSGTYIFNSSTNTGANRTGTWNVQGATVQVLGGRYFNSGGGTVAVSSGSLQFEGNQLSAGEQQSNGTAINFNVSGTGLLDVAAGSSAGFVVGAAGAAQQDGTSSVTVNQTGGTVQVGVNSPLANNGATGGQNLSIGNGSSQVQSSYNLSGGVLRVAGTIQGTAATATTGTLATTLGSNTATLATNQIHYVGEVLSGTGAGTAGVNLLSITAISGTTATLSGNATATSAAIAVTGTQPSANLYRVLNWTGGTITAGTINMTNLGGAGTGQPYTTGSTGTLFQTGSTSILAPGDTFDGIT